MLSSVLRSKTAIAVNIEIMRAFVALRRIAGSYAVLRDRQEGLEREMTARLDQHDERLEEVFKVLHQLITPPERPMRKAGFRMPEDDD